MAAAPPARAATTSSTAPRSTRRAGTRSCARNPSAYSVGGGELTITTEPGDIYTADTVPPPNNFILQSADHAGADWTLETKLSGTINGGYGQGGLIAHVDGGNYVKLDAISDAGVTRINRIELRSEIGDAVQEPQPNVDVPEGTTDIWLRLAKSGTTYSGEYSFDGVTWTAIAQTVENSMATPAFGLFAFGPQPDGVGDTVSFDYFTLDGPDEPCECNAAGDGFDAPPLDTNRWNAIERENGELRDRGRRPHRDDGRRRHLRGLRPGRDGQLLPAVRRPRRRGLRARDEAIRHDRRRLRAGRHPRLHRRRQLREVRRDLRRGQHAHQPHRAALRGRRRGAEPAAAGRRARRARPTSGCG